MSPYYIPLSILVMAGVTYLIRMAPFVLFRRKITSQYLQSMLYYLPYAVMGAMILPGVFSSTGSLLTACVGFGVAILLAFFRQSLIIVALGASLASYLSGLCFL